MNKKEELSQFSIEYQNKTEQKKRQKFGQYFTVKALRDIAFKKLPKAKDGEQVRVVELSCGSGEFIDTALERYPDAIIDGFEIEPELSQYCKQKYSENENVCIFGVNTLDYALNGGFKTADGIPKKYKFCVGNPPYFELDTEKPLKKLDDKRLPNLGQRLRKEYKGIINGRPNIYAIFIKLGIDLLEDGGYLSYVVPTSMLNGAYFSKLRDYIMQNCSIVDIVLKDANHFDGALQNVMILVLKKEPNDGKFIFTHNGITIFTPQWEELKSTFLRAKTLSELGFQVRTGNVVWNQRKSDLSDDSSNTLLIWADNITKSGFSMDGHKNAAHEKGKTNEEKKEVEKTGDEKSVKKCQYIKNIKKEELQKSPVIVVNRISGVGVSASLRASLYNDKKDFVCENHVNVISATKDACMTIEELLPHIQKWQAMKVMRNITGNTQISKTELEKLFPIWI